METYKMVEGFNDDRVNIRENGDPIIEFYRKGGSVAALICPMQFGKTAITQYVACNLVLSNTIHPDNFFLVTSLSDKSWLEQTRGRMLPPFAKHTYHNYGTRNFALAEVLAAIPRGKVFLGIDEAHHGAQPTNAYPTFLAHLAREICQEDVQGRQVFEVLQKAGVTILLISATPDMLRDNVIDMGVPLRNTLFQVVDEKKYPGYIGVYTYTETWKNVYQTRRLQDIITDQGETFVSRLVKVIYRKNTPKYHLFRLNKEDTEEMVREEITRLLGTDGDEEDDIRRIEFRHLDSTSGCDMTMADFEVAPTHHTIVFLRNMLRVAKTIPIQHIYLVVERPVKRPNDSTICQSLFGRMCGWRNPEDAQKLRIYTFVESLEKYKRLSKAKFDYSLVPEWVGARQYMEHKENFEESYDSDNDNDSDNEPKTVTDLPLPPRPLNEEVFLKVKRCIEKRLVVFEIFKRILENGNESVSCKDLLGPKKSISDYSRWDEEHGRYHILERTDRGMYRLTEDMVQRFGPLVRSMV